MDKLFHEFGIRHETHCLANKAGLEPTHFDPYFRNDGPVVVDANGSETYTNTESLYVQILASGYIDIVRHRYGID